VTATDRQLYALYATRFANSYGFLTLLTLLPKYIELFDPSGFLIGLFTTGLTLAQAVAVIPVSWAGDRFDKRTVLLGSLAVATVAYGGFAIVSSSAGFVLTRGLQGFALTGVGVLSLAMIGELASTGTRANVIGFGNSARFAGAILGTISAGALYEAFGFTAVFAVLVAVVGCSLLCVLVFVETDDSSVAGFPFADLAVNRRILTLTSFRAQYAVAVTLVRTWVPIYAGVSAAKGGLAYGAVAVSVVIVAEKVTNMLAQPYTGRLSDRSGRSLFVFVGGTTYGVVALFVPVTPTIGTALSLPSVFPILAPLSPAFLPLVVCNGLLGVADSVREPASMALFADEGADNGGLASSFGIRDLVWRPGSILAPMIGGFLMTGVGMDWVFYAGAIAAFSGVAVFVGILVATHGYDALTAW
jgi:MFS family permease